VGVFGLTGARASWAQTTAGITGVARDATGAVLPGVTVEASSPALIEKVRTAVTDGQGRFNITDLRPGVYTVTFTLAGFSTFRREGIELSAGFTATANAEMRVGGLEETVTVTGASPVVDIQNVRTQQVLKYDELEALPSGQRDLAQYAALTLGATPLGNKHDVGGNMGETNTGLSIHGGRADDGKINYDGMNTNVFYSTGGGQQRIWKFNTIGVQETVIDTGGASAETETGGANVNMIPRDGGNTFSLHSVLNYTNGDLSASKVPDSLVDRGSQPSANSLAKIYDYGVGVGGPIRRDRLWFYSANRFWGNTANAANNYFNKSPVWYRYEPDLSRIAHSPTWIRDVGGRITWQAAAKHKINTNLNWQQACNCWLGISAGAVAAPESVTSYYYGKDGGMWLSQTSWNYPATNQLLFQAVASFLKQEVHFTNDIRPNNDQVAITEQTTGYTWNALVGGVQGGSYDEGHPGDNFTQRFSMSYVTGTHAFKAGIQTLQGVYDTVGNQLPNGTQYTFRNGLPLSIRQHATPFYNNVRIRSEGVFVQDQWTFNRLTLNLGARYDHFTAFAKAITLPAGPFIGERSYPEVKDIPNFHDVTPRLGVSYDLFGNGKTAIKGGWGRYLAGQGGGDARDLSPAIAIIANTDRLWDDADHDFIPDCELRNLQVNGECGTVNNLAFGQPRRVTTWDDAARKGWGVREYSYQYSLALQHELLPNVGVTLSYNRNDWRNQQAIVNNALSRADYSTYCINAPSDARLGDFSGQQICNLYDANPDKFGQVDEVRMRWQDVAGANGRPHDVFNGIDIGVNARFAQGGLLAGGVTFGRTTFDYCWQNELPNVDQRGTPGNLPRNNDYCRIQSTLWNGVGSQIKVQAVYPLPYEFNVSGSFKDVPGITIGATYQASNAEVRESLGRDLSACRGAVPCAARAAVALVPVASSSGSASAHLYDERIRQVDLRLTRVFRVVGFRVQGIAELYNVFNRRSPLGIVSTYGSAWQLPVALLGGRLFKFGAQVDF
jgi:hypothetical protein